MNKHNWKIEMTNKHNHFYMNNPCQHAIINFENLLNIN